MRPRYVCLPDYDSATKHGEPQYRYYSPRMVATVEMNAGRSVVHTISCFAFVIVSLFEWSRQGEIQAE